MLPTVPYVGRECRPGLRLLFVISEMSSYHMDGAALNGDALEAIQATQPDCRVK